MLKGIVPATVTPFDEHGHFARAAFERLLDRLYGAGVHGVYVCGTTGEGMLQTARQREAVVEAAVANTPRGRHVIAHIGATSLEEARGLAVHAAKAGAHAISSLPPISANFSFAEVRAHYESLARATDLPLVVYYFPEICASISTVDLLEELCSLPNVVGVKFTDFDLYKLSLISRRGIGPESIAGAGVGTGSSRVVFNGRDEVLAAGLLMGANGGIGSFYNIVPELFVRIYLSAEAGRWDDARAAQREVNTLIRLVLRFPLFPALKQILAWSGVDCGACLLPRTSLDVTQRRALRDALVTEGFAGLVAAGATV